MNIGKFGGYMKKLLLLSFAISMPAVAMQAPKRKREELLAEGISYLDLSAIVPFRISALDGKESAGNIYFGKHPQNHPYGHIQYIHVQEPYRGQGIGYELFKRAIFALKRKGFKTIAWDAAGIDTVSIQDLEQIYLNYVAKLKKELKFDFVKEKLVLVGEDGIEMIPMRLILK